MQTATVERARHDKSVSMRIPQQTKELIERAAFAVQKTFSAFVIESAREHATDVLLDQTVFNLSAEQADAFAAVLDSPPAPTEKLKKLMKSSDPWDQ